MTELKTLLHTPVALAAFSGLVSAARVDFVAFKSWKSFHDAATYNWGTAIWRWVQGAIVGAASGSALSWTTA